MANPAHTDFDPTELYPAARAEYTINVQTCPSITGNSTNVSVCQILNCNLYQLRYWYSASLFATQQSCNDSCSVRNVTKKNDT